VSRSALFLSFVDHERWPNVTADLDTRAGELYAPMGEVLPFRRRGGDGAVPADRDAGRSLSEPAVAVGFAASREQFESLVSFMDGTDAAGLDHAGLEERPSWQPGCHVDRVPPVTEPARLQASPGQRSSCPDDPRTRGHLADVAAGAGP
jgi:hypothetical protein